VKNAIGFVAGLFVAWAFACASDAAAEKAAESYYDSPLECREVRQHLDACLEALGRCDAPE
jgi:hypothetical protein